MKRLRIHKRFFDLIKSGEKTLEIRVGYNNIKRIRPGDTVELISPTQNLECHVEDVRTYPDFTEFVAHEDMGRALPGMNAEEAEAQLRKIYPPEKERLGVYVLELKAPTA